VGIEESQCAIDRSNGGSESLWQFFGIDEERTLGKQISK
jgi:hypothetical protein